MKFLLEIGTEEIPAGFLPNGRTALKKSSEDILIKSGLTNFVITEYGSPRRLAILADNLPLKSNDSIETYKGPPLRVAFDSDGNPTKAAIGFAKKVGVNISEISKEGEYLIAKVHIPGRTLTEILSDAIPLIIESIPWPKSMRWNNSGKRFVRPVRWIVALLENNIVNAEWSGVIAGRNSFIRRMPNEKDLMSRPVPINSASEYVDTLRNANVIVDHRERIKFIRDGIEKKAKLIGAEPVLLSGEETFLYLCDHTEDPEIMVADFDTAFITAPREILELTMWRHQKYIPLIKNGKLIPKFILVSNRTFGHSSNDEANERRYLNVILGNRRVLSARLSDAIFFWKTDIERPLISRAEDLAKVTFQKDAGTVLQRVERITALALRIAPILKHQDLKRVERAVRLSKADLTTKLVFEFPELQGVIGKRIALHQGEDLEIAESIEEHYWPIGADPRIPKGLSAIVALAEKADTLHSIFGVGLEPTGSADPYGLRRAALGIIRILLENKISFDITNLISGEKVLNFVRQRLVNYISETLKINIAVLEAVAASGWHNFVDFELRAIAASKLKERSDFEDMVTSFKRVMNILDSEEGRSSEPSQEKFVEPAEKDLFNAVSILDRNVAENLSNGNIEEALDEIAKMRPLVDKFFDEVLVNTDDLSLRINRKALLNRLGLIFLRIMDFSRL
ncbi:MAG: glycine--tRNA ligase subunit beta [Candidatus Hydrogenedentes bacterium CG07_land_8_20_14_0_80_42_17]|nr:MAG: glycine--tRNA ligase subunit beta [Candidatus Hydrogenedentes bacterium CG07_land_8_20_14_0_80_42_17]